MKVTATTTFYHSDGGMWLQGETRNISEFRADELQKVGLVSPVSVEPEPTPQSQPEAPAKTSKKTLEPTRETKPLNPVTETK